MATNLFGRLDLKGNLTKMKNNLLTRNKFNTFYMRLWSRYYNMCFTFERIVFLPKDIWWIFWIPTYDTLLCKYYRRRRPLQETGNYRLLRAGKSSFLSCDIMILYNNCVGIILLVTPGNTRGLQGMLTDFVSLCNRIVVVVMKYKVTTDLYRQNSSPPYDLPTKYLVVLRMYIPSAVCGITLIRIKKKME